MKSSKIHLSIHNITIFLLLALCVVGVSGSASGADAPAQARAQAQNSRLEVRAPTQVEVGVPIKLELRLHDAGTVAGYEATLLWDQTVAEYGGLLDEENDLAKAGYSTHSLSAPELPGGLAFGLYSCTSADCLGDGAPSAIAPLGDDLYLGTIRLLPQQEGQLILHFNAAKFVDRAGNQLAVSVDATPLVIQVGSGNDSVLAAPAAMWSLAPAANAAAALQVDLATADLTADAAVDYSDLVEIALEWQLVRLAGNPCDTEANVHDINRDGCVDIADLQVVAANFIQRAVADKAALSVQAAARMATWVVDSTDDESDMNIGNGICATALTSCSLRAAIQEANVSVGADTITFHIPGNGVQTIQLTKRLTTIADLTGGVTIDGYTQPGAMPNSDPQISNAVILIEIVGNGAEEFDGLVFTSGNHTVRGMALYNFRRPLWIFGDQADNNTIAGMFIGTNAAGTFATPLEGLLAHGIHIEQDSGGNRIGGPTPAERNVISGNGRHGVGIWHNNSDNNSVVNNIIGLAPDGRTWLPNRKHGVDLNFGSSENVVGGSGQYEHNVIAGNDDSGVEVSHTDKTTNNLVIGNYIGTNISGTMAYTWTMNSGRGIMLEDGVTGNTVANNVIGNSGVGGIEIRLAHTVANLIRDNRVGISLDDSPIGNVRFGIIVEGNNNRIGPGNIIAHNGSAGVELLADDADGNLITQNSFFANGTLGIELAPPGSNPNDSGDGDSGPNQQLNSPELTNVYPAWVAGTVCANCTVEIYLATRAIGEFGEGVTFLASGVSDAQGAFAILVPTLAPGQVVTALAIDGNDNTSEFAANIAVQPDCAVDCEPPTPLPTFTPTPTFTATPIFTPTPTMTPTQTPSPCDTICKLPTPAGTVTSVPQPTPIPQLLAHDQFTRTLAADWGNADSGGPYTLLRGATVDQDFSVTGAEGEITHQGSYPREALLETISVQNTDILVRFKMATQPQKRRDIYLVARRIDQFNLYRGRIGVRPNGQVELQIQRQVAGAWSVFTTFTLAPDVTYTAGDYLWARLQVIGANPTTVRLQVWEDGGVEPLAWPLTVYDSSLPLQGAGTVGVHTYITPDENALPVSFFFDQLTVTEPSLAVVCHCMQSDDTLVRAFTVDELSAEGLAVLFIPIVLKEVK